MDVGSRAESASPHTATDQSPHGLMPSRSNDSTRYALTPGLAVLSTPTPAVEQVDRLHLCEYCGKRFARSILFLALLDVSIFYQTFRA
jgi:hypothetical protein